MKTPAAHVILILAIILMGCNKPAKEVTQEGAIAVELLFEKDGCKVYRFTDVGRNIYYSDCRGRAEYTYTTGGKSTQKHNVQTLNN